MVMDIFWKKSFLCITILGFLLSSCVQTNETANVQESLKKTEETEPLVTGSLITVTPSETETPPAAEPDSANTIQDSPEPEFTKSYQILGTSTSFSIAAADIDLDDDMDIFFANYTSPSQLWLNDGTGKFSKSQQVFGPPNTQGAHGVGIQDLNGDTFPDIFLIYHGSPGKVFFNDGANGFTDSQQDLGTVNDNPQSVVLGDIDNDGDIDAFITFPRAKNRLWINDGNGYFERSDIEFGGTTSPKMLLLDFNDDDLLDIFYCFIDRPGEIWFNTGQGNFENSGQAVGDQYGCEDFDGGDIDGDGDNDIVLGNFENGVKIWLNEQNTGIFFETGPYLDPGTIKTRLFDADLDGDLDLITGNSENGIELWINEGVESFRFIGPIFGTDLAHGITIGDLDSDNDIDVIIASGSNPGKQEIYFNKLND